VSVRATEVRVRLAGEVTAVGGLRACDSKAELQKLADYTGLDTTSALPSTNWLRREHRVRPSPVTPIRAAHQANREVVTCHRADQAGPVDLRTSSRRLKRPSPGLSRRPATAAATFLDDDRHRASPPRR